MKLEMLLNHGELEAGEIDEVGDDNINDNNNEHHNEKSNTCTLRTFTAVASKNTKSDKVGLRMVRNKRENVILVSCISENSLFVGTELLPGMRLLSMNSVSAEGKTVGELSTVIAEAEGEVKIKACEHREVSASVATCSTVGDSVSSTASAVSKASESSGDVTIVKATKTSVSQNTGIRLHQMGNQVTVQSVADTSIFARTALTESTPILAINGVESNNKNTEAMSDIIAQAQGDIMITVPRAAVSPPQTSPADRRDSNTCGDNPDSLTEVGPDVVIVTARKPSMDAKIGIRLKKNRTGTIFVQEIIDTSIFVRTHLAVGMPVLSINGVETSGKSVKDMSYVVSQASGDVEVKAIGSLSARVRASAVPPTDNVPPDDIAPPPVVVTPFESFVPVMTAAPAGSPPNSIMVTVIKKTKDQKIGIRLRTGPDRTILLATIYPYSGFHGSFEVGWFLVSVNGVGYQGMRIRDLRELIVGKVGPVTLVASHSNPAVYAAQQRTQAS